MIRSKDPMGWTRQAIKPGRMPEPLAQERTRDPPELVAACLSCPLPECRMSSMACPICGYNTDVPYGKRKRRKKL